MLYFRRLLGADNPLRRIYRSKERIKDTVHKEVKEIRERKKGIREKITEMKSGVNELKKINQEIKNVSLKIKEINQEIKNLQNKILEIKSKSEENEKYQSLASDYVKKIKSLKQEKENLKSKLLYLNERKKIMEIEIKLIELAIKSELERLFEKTSNLEDFVSDLEQAEKQKKEDVLHLYSTFSLVHTSGIAEIIEKGMEISEDERKFYKGISEELQREVIDLIDFYHSMKEELEILSLEFNSARGIVSEALEVFYEDNYPSIFIDMLFNSDIYYKPLHESLISGPYKEHEYSPSTGSYSSSLAVHGEETKVAGKEYIPPDPHARGNIEIWIEKPSSPRTLSSLESSLNSLAIEPVRQPSYLEVHWHPSGVGTGYLKNTWGGVEGTYILSYGCSGLEISPADEATIYMEAERSWRDFSNYSLGNSSSALSLF